MYNNWQNKFPFHSFHPVPGQAPDGHLTFFSVLRTIEAFWAVPICGRDEDSSLGWEGGCLVVVALWICNP